MQANQVSQNATRRGNALSGHQALTSVTQQERIIGQWPSKCCAALNPVAQNQALTVIVHQDARASKWDAGSSPRPFSKISADGCTFENMHNFGTSALRCAQGRHHYDSSKHQIRQARPETPSPNISELVLQLELLARSWNCSCICAGTMLPQSCVFLSRAKASPAPWAPWFSGATRHCWGPWVVERVMLLQPCGSRALLPMKQEGQFSIGHQEACANHVLHK